MPYAVLNLQDNQYDGWRMVESDWVLSDNETLVNSLSGFSERKPQTSVSEKRQILIEQFKSLPVETRVFFQNIALAVSASLELNDVELAIYNLEEAKKEPTANAALINSMIDTLNN